MAIDSAADRSVAVSKYLMTETTRYGDIRKNLPMLVCGSLKNVGDSLEKRAASSEHAPCVMVRDLEKARGDHIEIPVIHDITGLPKMGNRVVEGTGESWGESNYTLKIDVTRKAIDAQTKLTQQRRGYNVLGEAQRLIKTWWNKLETERFLYHCVGRRGTQMRSDQILPLNDGSLSQDAHSFDELMTNPIKPSTHNRTLFASGPGRNVNSIDGTAMTNTQNLTPITAADTISVAGIRLWKEQMEDHENPVQEASLTTMYSGKERDTDPMYFGFLTPQQWTQLQTDMGDSGFLQLVAESRQRTAGWNHPIFQQNGVMIDNIYFQKYFLPITYSPADEIPMADDDADGTTQMQTVPAGIQVHCGFILGASAIAKAYGQTMPGGDAWDIHTRKWDGDFRKEIIVSNMSGCSKIDHYDAAGRRYDRGVLSILSAVEV